MSGVLRKRARNALILAGGIAVLISIVPAAGQGKAETLSVVWKQGSRTTASYDFGPLASHSSTTTTFKLADVSKKARSGELTIGLTGSSAFSITANNCTGKNLYPNTSCRVIVKYTQVKSGSRGGAVLTAMRKNIGPVRLKLFGGLGHVYFVNSNGTLKRARIGGGNLTTLATPEAELESLAMDATHLYFLDYLFGGLYAVPIRGGAPTPLGGFGTDGEYSLAVHGAYAYWVNVLDGTVDKAPLDGGSVTTLATGQDNPSDVAVDDTSVYWVNENSGTVNEVPIGGGSVTSLASGQDHPHSLAVDGTSVYWVNYGDGTVNKVPLGGGSVTTIATGQADPASVAVYGTSVYWVNALGGAVRTVSVGGGSVTTIANSQGSLDGVAVDSKNVYWIAANGGPPWGVVSQAPRTGGRVTVLATGEYGPTALVVGP